MNFRDMGFLLSDVDVLARERWDIDIGCFILFQHILIYHPVGSPEPYI